MVLLLALLAIFASPIPLWGQSVDDLERIREITEIDIRLLALTGTPTTDCGEYFIGALESKFRGAEECVTEALLKKQSFRFTIRFAAGDDPLVISGLVGNAKGVTYLYAYDSRLEELRSPAFNTDDCDRACIARFFDATVEASKLVDK